MVRDFRFAFRQLRKNLKFSLMVVLTLTLGVGATTAIFSVVSGVLLRSLPFPHPERLISLQTKAYPQDVPKGLVGNTMLENVSIPDFFDWRDQTHTFEAIASYAYGTSRKFTPEGNSQQPIIIDAEFVSSDFFRVLGVAPLLGRSFVLADETDATRPIILSHQFWVSQFHKSPAIIGKHITLSDRPATVVGVMPAGFAFPDTNRPPAYWATFLRVGLSALQSFPGPQKEAVSPASERNSRNFMVVARLKSNVSMAEASAEMNVIQRSLAAQYAEDRNAPGVEAQLLLNSVTGDARQPLYLLFAAVAALLLIACTNVAGLLLARGLARQSEFSIRFALGAKPSQIMRQVLIESTVLACCAGTFGIGLASILLRTFLALAPENLPRLVDVRIDSTVAAFAFLISLATGICFGAIPARTASRQRSFGLRAGRGLSTTRNEHRLRGILVVVETAVSLILLAGAGLLIRSFTQTMRVPTGFDPHHLLALRLGMSRGEYPDEKVPLFFRELLSRLSAIPGVESVSTAYPIPFPYDLESRFSVTGKPADPNDLPSAILVAVGTQYFETLRIPLLKGRTFDQRDDENAKPVAIVNREFTQTFFPGEDPIGKSIRPDFTEVGGKPTWFEIVGVVGDIRTADLTQNPRPQFFLPYVQAIHGPQWVILRVAGQPMTYMNSVRSEVAALNRNLPIFAETSFDDLIEHSTTSDRFEAALLTGFAACALFLAAVGLYAALSEMVARHTFELGLRVALGAQREDVFVLVVRRGLLLAAIGLIAGLIGFSILGRVVAGMLYSVRAFDLFTMIAAGATLILASFLASAVPAWRAARLEPTEALREL